MHGNGLLLEGKENMAEHVENLFPCVSPGGATISLRQLRCKWFAVGNYSITTCRLAAKANSSRE
jgi:hypothetical protein